MEGRVGPLQRIFGLLLVVCALSVGFSYVPDRPVQALVARWAPPPSDFIELQGQLVHLRDEGPRNDRLPVVLVHGTASSLHTWEGWAAGLRSHRRVISFDLPGFGLTGPNDSGVYNATSDARFTLKLMDALKVQRFVIGGNSLGGEVAWRTAAMAPDRVAGLILVDSAGYDAAPDHLPIGFMLARLPGVNRLMDYLTPKSLVERSVREVYGNPDKVSPELVDRYYELLLREGNRRALSERFQQIEPHRDSSAISTLKLPTLILWGGLDRLIPPANARRFNTDIQGSRLVMFEALGHVPQEEDPAGTLRPVEAFLNR